MTKPKQGEPGEPEPDPPWLIQRRNWNLQRRMDELEHLIDVQATLLRRAMLSGDILRWKCLDAGIPIDCPPEMRHPVTGALPPGSELTVEEQPVQANDPRPAAKVETGGGAEKAPRKQKGKRMEEELVRVPAPSDMERGDFARHLKLRHEGTFTEEGHTADHYHSPNGHVHLPDAWSREQAAMADIRSGSIEPLNSETLYISGYDSWGEAE